MSESHTITCDHCGRVENMVADTTFSRRTYYPANVWFREDGKDLCSRECRREYLIGVKPSGPRIFSVIAEMIRVVTG